MLASWSREMGGAPARTGGRSASCTTSAQTTVDARRYIELGFVISIHTSVTHPKADAAREVVRGTSRWSTLCSKPTARTARLSAIGASATSPPTWRRRRRAIAELKGRSRRGVADDDDAQRAAPAGRRRSLPAGGPHGEGRRRLRARAARPSPASRTRSTASSTSRTSRRSRRCSRTCSPAAASACAPRSRCSPAHFGEYDADLHVPLAASIELLHTATLVHDDVIDASPSRRGRPTANELFNNSASVMLGDYMFAHSRRPHRAHRQHAGRAPLRPHHHGDRRRRAAPGHERLRLRPGHHASTSAASRARRRRSSRPRRKAARWSPAARRTSARRCACTA